MCVCVCVFVCVRVVTSQSVQDVRNERFCGKLLRRSRARPPPSAANFTPDAPQSEVEAEDLDDFAPDLLFLYIEWIEIALRER